MLSTVDSLSLAIAQRGQILWQAIGLTVYELEGQRYLEEDVRQRDSYTRKF